jgi:hypothetical protein
MEPAARVEVLCRSCSRVSPMTVACVPKASAGSSPFVSFDPDTEPEDDAAEDAAADVVVELDAAALPP